MPLETVMTKKENMKNLLIALTAFLIAIPVWSQSEGFRYGCHFALGTSTFGPARSLNEESKLSFNTGIAVNYQFNKNFGLNMNALLASKGSKINGVITTSSGGLLGGGQKEFRFEDNYRFLYAELPVLPKVSVGIGNLYFKAFAGPSFNFNLLNTLTRTYDDAEYNSDHGFDRKYDDVEVMEYSVVYGTGIDVETDESRVFFLDIRFNNALKPFGRIAGNDAYNKYFSIGIGYLY
jgi:hypothetical protein